MSADEQAGAASDASRNVTITLTADQLRALVGFAEVGREAVLSNGTYHETPLHRRRVEAAIRTLREAL